MIEFQDFLIYMKEQPWKEIGVIAGGFGAIFSLFPIWTYLLYKFVIEEEDATRKLNGPIRQEVYSAMSIIPFDDREKIKQIVQRLREDELNARDVFETGLKPIDYRNSEYYQRINPENRPVLDNILLGLTRIKNKGGIDYRETLDTLLKT